MANHDETPRSVVRRSRPVRADTPSAEERSGSEPKELDSLSTDELRLLEQRTDGLLDLIGYVDRRLPASSGFDDARLLAWLGREHHGRGSREADPEQLGPEEIGRLTRRMASAARAESLGVKTLTDAPERRAVAHPGPVSRVLEELAVGRGAALLDLSVAAGIGRELWDAECDTWIPLPPGLENGPYLGLTIAGDSMTPALQEGDVVLVRLSSDVAPNTIVVVRLPDDGYVVKRVERLDSRWLELLPLNPSYPSMRVRRGPGVVLGTAVYRWCGDGD